MAKKLKTVEGVADENTAVVIPTAPIPTPAPSNNDELVNPLLTEQIAQSAQMRDSLLICRTSDIVTAKGALQNIAVLQVYHQVARIIRLTEVMDRLEDKLYASIDANLSQMDEFDPATMMMLVKVQGDLTKSMILSQDLLKPYMDIDIEAIAPMKEVGGDDAFGAVIIPQESRTAIRNGAQALLTELRKSEQQHIFEAQEATEPQEETANTENPSDSEVIDVGTPTANAQ